MSTARFATALLTAFMMIAGSQMAFSHGDVTPQPIDTEGLDPLGPEWRTLNPYVGNAKAIEIGTSGYNQNCARCHGLEAISGGIAPDLRKLETGPTGDDWFINRIRNGAKKSDGTTIMPGFETVFNQEAMWAIRAYLVSVHVEE
jgi:cytochrome c-550 PedF